MPSRNPCSVTGSGTGSPVTTELTSAANATVSASTPIVSLVGDSGTTPSLPHRPTLGRNPTIPQYDAGMRTEPPVSVPSASGTSPAATAAALPPLDPPAERPGALGLATVPNAGL